MKTKKVLYLCITLVFALLLVACASAPPEPVGPAFEKTANPTEGTALVYIFRAYHDENGARAWPVIFINGQRVAELRQNRYTWLSLKPGSYSLTTENVGWAGWFGSWGTINLEVAAGKSYYIGYVVTTGKPKTGVIFTGTIVVLEQGYEDVKAGWSVMSEVEAQPWIYTCRYVTPEIKLISP